MDSIERIVATALTEGMAIGAAQVIQELGLHSGEMTERQARKTYGAWFIEAVERGDLRPSRYSEGERSHKFYNIQDILTYRAKKKITAKLR